MDQNGGPSFRDDRRGLATGIIGFFAILVVAALLFIMLDPALDTIFDMTLAQADSQRATDTIKMRQRIWAGVLYFVLLCAGLYIIARSVFESRRPGR